MAPVLANITSAMLCDINKDPVLLLKMMSRGNDRRTKPIVVKSAHGFLPTRSEIQPKTGMATRQIACAARLARNALFGEIPLVTTA